MRGILKEFSWLTEVSRLAKILVVEDERKIARLLELELNHRKYETRIARDGMEAMDIYEAFKPDLILLDIMIPEIDGVEVAKLIRQMDNDVGIIMVTAMDQTRNKVEGLNSGADDYITKPFDFDEMSARIEALLRRKGNPKKQRLEIGEVELFPDSYTVIEQDREINLSKTEFDLLRYLAENRGRAVSKSELLEEVWGIDYESSPNVVEVYINYLRKKLKTGKSLIKTVRGVGYSIK